MNYHHKYQKKGRYLLHPGLIEFKRAGWGVQWKFNLTALLILGLMDLYPIAIMSFDLIMAFLVISAWTVGLPLMLKGKSPVKPYYKRDYHNDNFLFICKIILHGAVVRTAIITVFYAFQWYLSQGERSEMINTQHTIESIVINPIPQAIALMIFLFLFYYMFLKEKYISIPDFTKEVMKIIQRNNRPINEAVREFIIGRDSAIEKEMLNGLRYEQEEDSSPENVKENVQKRVNKVVVQNVAQIEPNAPIRRQSRR